MDAVQVVGEETITGMTLFSRLSNICMVRLDYSATYRFPHKDTTRSETKSLKGRNVKKIDQISTGNSQFTRPQHESPKTPTSTLDT
jgi:hypothetical protein